MNKLAKYLQKNGLEKTAVLDGILGKDGAKQIRKILNSRGGPIDRIFDATTHAIDILKSNNLTSATMNLSRDLPGGSLASYLPKAPNSHLEESLALANSIGDRYSQIKAKLDTAEQNKGSLLASYAFGNKSSNPYTVLKDALKLKHKKFEVAGAAGSSEFLNMTDAVRKQAYLGVQGVLDKYHDDPVVRDFKYRFERGLSGADKKGKQWAHDILNSYERAIKEKKTPTLTIFTPGPRKKVYLKEDLKLPFAVSHKGPILDMAHVLGDSADGVRKKFNDLAGKVGPEEHAQLGKFKELFGRQLQTGTLALGDLNTMNKVKTFFTNPVIKDSAGVNSDVLASIINKIESRVFFHGGSADKALLSVLQEGASNPSEARVLDILKFKRMESGEAKEMIESLSNVGQKTKNELARVGMDAVGTALAVPVVAGIPYLLYKSRKNRKDKAQAYDDLVSKEAHQ